MTTKTSNLELNAWTKADRFDVSEINENFQIIDNLVSIKEAGISESTYSGAETGTANWRYTKYSNGVYLMETVITLSSTKCSNGSAFPYYSEDITINIPTTLTSIYNVNFNMESETNGWIKLKPSTSTSLIFNVNSVTVENDPITKIIYISVKGIM